MKTLAFTAMVYPRASIDAAVAEFSAVAGCRIIDASADEMIVELDDEAVLRELANFALEHAVVSRL